MLLGHNPRAKPLADCHAVAGIPLVAERMIGHRLRHERSAKFLVVRIAAGCKHDAFPGFDHEFFIAEPNARTEDGAPVAQNVDDRGAE